MVIHIFKKKSGEVAHRQQPRKGADDSGHWGSLRRKQKKGEKQKNKQETSGPIVAEFPIVPGSCTHIHTYRCVCVLQSFIIGWLYRDID